MSRSTIWQPPPQDASNWAAVPEPTSGLLMLLGIAGLALCRRRA
ncbi:MAG: PEP-CTERM sorting domain-containing protein [Acutalibacteraceae bacterium]